MPLFEYACRDCGHRFEFLTRQGHQPACPACHGEALEKQLSVFAVSTGPNTDSRIATEPCGTCGDPRGPGTCSIH
jgi:putative FmdB family regulatory protein